MNEVSVTDHILHDLKPWQLFWLQEAWQYLINSDRHGKLAHAYILEGDKDFAAEQFLSAFVQYLHCSNREQDIPCGKCQHCSQIKQNVFADFRLVTVSEKKKDISVEQIREISHFFQQTGHTQGFRIVGIIEAEKMNQSSANALLKTLEEPGENSLIFLVSNHSQRLSDTVKSRCHTLNLTRINSQNLIHWLKSFHIVEQNEQQWLKTIQSADCKPLAALNNIQNNAVDDERHLLQLFTNYLSKSLNLNEFLHQVKVYSIEQIWHWIGLELCSPDHLSQLSKHQQTRLIQLYLESRRELLSSTHVDKWLLFREFLIKSVAN